MRIFTIILMFCALLVMPQFQADVQADDEDMYACVKKNNGQFRLVDDPEECNPSEYYIEYEIDGDELEVDICFTNNGCTLNLHLDTDDGLFSVIGSEICTDGQDIVQRHVYGSGFSIAEELFRIGLTFTGTESHEGKVFLLDLGNGLCDTDITTCESGGYAYTPGCDQPE